MARGKQGGNPVDWVARAADDAVRHAGAIGDQGAAIVTCSSGVSPSGRVHLGNMREFLTVHFVADELRRRGVPMRHLHVWDDYDRFRKVPVGVDASYAEHIGRPLSAVPDPWECHPSWAEHYKEPLRDALHAMGVEMEEISQTERYRSGYYREDVLHAVRHRAEIEQVLARFRTRKVDVDAASEQEADALADSVADADDAAGDGGTDELGRFPFKPYCRGCGRDTTTITAYDDDTTDLSYTCDSCGESHVTNLATQDEGKLVWKVDWPMRWAKEHVDFEPAGMDHATPGSSFSVGHELVESVFGMPRPSWFGYAFVGFAGVQKMSSSAGGAPTAQDALRILEPPILRWLYVRRSYKQAFDIDFGPEVVRLYDEWDALSRKAADPAKRDLQVLAYERASATASGPLPTAEVVVPFRTLSSVADVTAGSAEQISRIVGDVGYPARVRRPARAAAVQGDGLDGGVRRTRGPHHRPHRARPGSARIPDRARVGVAGAPPRRPGRRCRARPGHRADLRRAQARPRTLRRRPADRRGEGRPEGLLPAALPAAGRRRPGPTPPHAGDGARRRQGAVAAHAVTVARVQTHLASAFRKRGYRNRTAPTWQ